MSHEHHPSTSKNCAIVVPTFVNNLEKCVQPPTSNIEKVENCYFVDHAAYTSRTSDGGGVFYTQNSILPYSVPPPTVSYTSASEQCNSGLHSSSVYIAQPININLELHPKIHVPESVSFSSNSSCIPPNVFVGSPQLLLSKPLINKKEIIHHESHFKELSATLEGEMCWNSAVSGWEQATLIKNKIGLIVNKRYKIVQSIASGSYGEIFVAEDLCIEPMQRVAVKFDTGCRDDHLKYEYDVYKSVLYNDGVESVVGFPKVFWFGHEYGHNVLVMELLGAPLASLFAFCDRKFGKQTIVSLGEQMIQRIKHLHRRGFIHRDIKPENFLIGIGEMENTCYLIDFGLARRYRFRENRDLKHIPYRKGRHFVGTAKYASLNSHKNIELSRRDDLESLGYVLIELINGNLPWKNISKRNTTFTRHQTSSRIRSMKDQTNWSEVCPSMAKFIKYCRELPFSDNPNYEVLIKYVREIATEDDLSIGREYLKCDSCASKPICNTNSSFVKNSNICHPPPVIHPYFSIPSSRIADKTICNVAPHSGGNVICQIPYTLIQPIDECVTAVQALSLVPNKSIKPMNNINSDIANKPIVIPSTSKIPDKWDSGEAKVSCKQCRECFQLIVDQQIPSAGRFGSKNPQRMSWQIWRDSTLDRRFQYDNRFSWTVGQTQNNFSPSIVSQSSLPTNGIGLRLDTSVPPPPIPFSSNSMICQHQQILPHLSSFSVSTVAPHAHPTDPTITAHFQTSTAYHFSLPMQSQSLLAIPAISVNNDTYNSIPSHL